MSAIYTLGHERIAALCARYSQRGESGVEAVIALSYDLIQQAAADPLARVVYSLECTGYAAETALESVYSLWRARVTEMLTGSDGSTDPLLIDTEYRRVCEIVDVLVAALAGFCDPRRPSADAAERLDRLHLVFQGLLPALCTDTSYAEYLRLYLARVHLYARTAHTSTTRAGLSDVAQVSSVQG